jgi:DUF2911 family protein
MRIPLPLFSAVAALSFLAPPVRAALDLPLPSPKASVTQTIGLTTVTVRYSRPAVKGRTIWGEVVPYDEPWRTGENEATTITFSDDVKVMGNRLAAGTYGLFTIPRRRAWTVVFSRQTDLWGAVAYKPEQDALRIEVKPETAEHEEWLQFSFDSLAIDAADLVLRWERLELAVPIATDDVPLALDNVRAQVSAAKPHDWRTLYRAAYFLDANDLEPETAMQWAQRSVTLQPGYLNLTLLARIKAKAGNLKDAIECAQRAIKVGRDEKADTRPAERMLAEWTAK